MCRLKNFCRINYSSEILIIVIELQVHRLSGYRSISLTSIQVANLQNMEPVYYHYQFLNILHFLIGQIEANELQFPILAQFLDQSQKMNLTFSTEKTYALLKQGY